MAHVRVTRKDDGYSYSIGNFDSVADAESWKDTATELNIFRSVELREDEAAYPNYKTDQTPQQVSDSLIRREKAQEIQATIRENNDRIAFAIVSMHDAEDDNELLAYARVIRREHAKTLKLLPDYKANEGSFYDLGKLDIYPGK